MQYKTNSLLKIPLLYGVLGILWILLSDKILYSLIKDENLLSFLSITKGWFYVILTSFLLYLLIKRYVTSLIHANKLLVHNEEKLRTIFRQAVSPILFLNMERRILDANTSAINLINQPYDKIKGCKIEELISPDDRKKLTDYIEQNNKEIENNNSIEIRLAEGENPKWISLSGSGIYDNDGEYILSILIFEDITARIEYRNNLIHAKEMAEKSDHLKSEFLAQMSHEIRTPLNTILSYTSIIKEEISDKQPEMVNSLFSPIEKSSVRLIRTIELLLNMAQVETGNFDMLTEEFDISDAVNETIIILKRKAEEKNLYLKFENSSNKSIIRGDRYSIVQTFTNLIENAIKYTKSGGVSIILHDTESHICADIIDTGIGIADEYKSKIFLPFMQEDSGYSRGYEGTGLGLALVKKYIEINSAEISFSSVKGKGSIFTVKFKPVN